MERLLEGMASPTMKSRITAVEDLQVRPCPSRRERTMRPSASVVVFLFSNDRGRRRPPSVPSRPAAGHARAARRDSRRPRPMRRPRPRGVTPTGARTARTPRPIVATVACRLVSCVRWRARIRRNPGSRLARARFRRTSQPPRAYALTRATDPFTPHDVRFDGRTTARTHGRTDAPRRAQAARSAALLWHLLVAVDRRGRRAGSLVADAAQASAGR